ncbi:hypothetical protein Tsubulata_045575, partial [Turnera subulata]
MTSTSASMDLQSPPPATRHKVVSSGFDFQARCRGCLDRDPGVIDGGNETRDLEGLVGNALAGDGVSGIRAQIPARHIFSGIGDDVEEEHWLYNLYVVYYDDGDKPREKVFAYMNQIAESEDFDIEVSPDAFIGSIRPLDHAIAQNNADPVKPKLEFVRLKKANFSSCAGRKYYITFVAKDVTLGKNFTFQAKILYGIGGCLKVLIFRPLYKSP